MRRPRPGGRRQDHGPQQAGDDVPVAAAARARRLAVRLVPAGGLRTLHRANPGSGTSGPRATSCSAASAATSSRAVATTTSSMVTTPSASGSPFVRTRPTLQPRSDAPTSWRAWPSRGTFGTGTTGMTLQQAVFAGLVNPGNLVAVRGVDIPTSTPNAGPAGDCPAPSARWHGPPVVDDEELRHGAVHSRRQ